MSFVTLLTTKLTQQDISEPWEDKYPNDGPCGSISLAGHSF